MIILAIIEIPINRLAFEYFFDAETRFIAFAIAAAIGSMIVFFAHVGGTYLKYSTCKELKPNLTKTYSLVFFVDNVFGGQHTCFTATGLRAISGSFLIVVVPELLTAQTNVVSGFGFVPEDLIG